MPEQSEEQQSIKAMTPETSALIAGKELAFYWRAAQLFVAILVILEIIVIVMRQTRFGVWIAVALVALLFTWWLLQRWHVRLSTALAANAMLGIVAGLLMAVFEIIWYHQWWYVMNLIRRPVMLGAAATVAGCVFYIVFQSIIKKNTIKESKGGGIYGGTTI